MATSSETKAVETTYNGESFTVLFDSRPDFLPLVVKKDGTIMLSSEETRAIIASAA